MFAFLAILNGEQLLNNENIVPPLWVINSLVLVILGIFTMRPKWLSWLSGLLSRAK